VFCIRIAIGNAFTAMVDGWQHLFIISCFLLLKIVPLSIAKRKKIDKKIEDLYWKPNKEYGFSHPICKRVLPALKKAFWKDCRP